jgi:molybdopterin biosynthesis enzyme
MRKILVDQACGEVLDYDITGVDLAEGTKKRVFKRGHIIVPEDIEILKNLGREQLFVRDDNDIEVHEDDASKILAPFIAGKNITYDREPSEGKIRFYSQCSGVFRVDVERLYAINDLEIPSLPAIHNNFPVKENENVAAFRIVPLTCPAEMIEQIKEILSEPVISCEPYSVSTVSIIVTGNEIFTGRKNDGFVPLLSSKLRKFGVTSITSEILPDDRQSIAKAVSYAIEESELLILTGGTSVDPDDATRLAMEDAGVTFLQKGSPAQPGNNLSLGYMKGKPVIAIPAAALTYHATSLDIFLPRIMADIPITKHDIVASAHGGLCHYCSTCHYPVCPFGRGV